MTVEEFNASLRQFGQQLQVSETNSFWEQAIEKVANDLKDLGVTSDPNTNIGWEIQGDAVSLLIAPHILFQNYGVKGLTNTQNQYGVPAEVGLQPLSGNEYEFGVNPSGKHYWGIHYPGIGAKYDFDINTGSYNITEELLRYFDAIVEQQTQI